MRVCILKEMLYEVRYLKSSEDMILALTGQFKQLIKLLKLSSKCEDHIFTLISNTALHTTFLSYYIPFTGKHEPNKLTCSQLYDFVAQLVRVLHRHRRGHGFESR